MLRQPSEQMHPDDACRKERCFLLNQCNAAVWSSDLETVRLTDGDEKMCGIGGYFFDLISNMRKNVAIYCEKTCLPLIRIQFCLQLIDNARISFINIVSIVEDTVTQEY